MKQLLLVEDDPLSRTVVKDMFKYNDVPGELVCVESGEEALAAGCDGYFVKPIDTANLAFQLRGLFENLQPEPQTHEKGMVLS